MRDSRAAECVAQLWEQDQTGRHIDTVETLHEGHEPGGMHYDNIDAFSSL